MPRKPSEGQDNRCWNEPEVLRTIRESRGRFKPIIDKFVPSIETRDLMNLKTPRCRGSAVGLDEITMRQYGWIHTPIVEGVGVSEIRSKNNIDIAFIAFWHSPPGGIRLYRDIRSLALILNWCVYIISILGPFISNKVSRSKNAPLYFHTSIFAIQIRAAF